MRILPTHTTYAKYAIGKIDGVQAEYVDFWGGANEISLKDSQRNFIRFGAIEERFITRVRKSTLEEARDNNWKT